MMPNDFRLTSSVELAKTGSLSRRLFCVEKNDPIAGPYFPPYDSVKRLMPIDGFPVGTAGRLPGLYCGKVARKPCRKCQIACAATAEVFAVADGLSDEKVPLRKVDGGCVTGSDVGGYTSDSSSRLSDAFVARSYEKPT